MPPRLNIPPVTRIVLIVLVLQSFLSAAIRYSRFTYQSHIVVPYLNLIPQLSVLYPWTFLSTTLVESNVFTLAIAGVTIYQGGRYLERAWSSRELAKFLLIVSLIPNLLTFAVLIFLFSLTQNEKWTLTTVGGTIPIQISFLIAFSQLIPAHTVTLFRGVLSLRVPRFPILYLVGVLALALTPILTAASALLAVFGFLTSWTYLRFYKSVFPDLDSSQPNSLRGDASETFALAEFFPGPIKPFVAVISDAVFNVLVAVHLCTPFTAADISARAAAGNDYMHPQRSVPGSTRAEAERRRALALKALDQRLHAAAANAAARAPGGAASSSAAGASSVPTQPEQPPPVATGPTVQVQPKPNTQAAMVTQPTSSGALGETNYSPDNGSNEDKSSA